MFYAAISSYREVELQPQNIHIAPYQTLLETDEEVNHMPRKHLNSRVAGDITAIGFFSTKAWQQRRIGW